LCGDLKCTDAAESIDAEPNDELLISDRALGTDQSRKFVPVVGDDSDR
jgi:hypothetical protein